MSSPALSKTRIALGVLMATATLATTGIAGTLALARNQTTNSDTADNTAAATMAPTSTTTRTKHHKTNSDPQTFTPASTPSPTTGKSHTKTKGS